MSAGFTGVTDLPPLYSLFPPAVRARFDMVGFDPRGIGQSTDFQCFDTIDQENQLLSALPGAFPVGAAQERVFQSTYATHAKYDILLDQLASHPVTLSGKTFTTTLAIR